MVCNDVKSVVDPVELYQDNIKLTTYFVHLYYSGVVQGSFLHEELVAEARIGLWKAAKAYKPEMCKFVTFASRCIFSQITKYYSRVHKKQSVAFDVSLSKLFSDSDVSLEDTLISDFDTETAAFSDIATKRIKEKYPTLKLYFLEDYSQQEIANRLGKSQVQISRNVRSELKNIRNELKLA